MSISEVPAGYRACVGERGWGQTVLVKGSEGLIERWWLFPFDQRCGGKCPTPFICFFVHIPWKQLGSLLIRKISWPTWVGLMSLVGASVSPTERCYLQCCLSTVICLCAAEPREWLVFIVLA